MAVSVRKITLWRREIEDRPGALARVLAPLADAGASLQVVMGYRYPEPAGQAAVELAPVSGGKTTSAAREAGLAPAEIGALLVEGDDRPGLGRSLSDAIGGSGINLHFLMALVAGRRYAAVFGFGSEEDAARAVPIIKKAAAARPARKPGASRRRTSGGKKAAGRKAARKGGRGRR
ncbi:MAG TPA: hypothetical protein VMR21_11100 [Vicinamibacteria bacterium]|nr:hypothetical protein [Vicinamibacteria bacterium]